MNADAIRRIAVIGAGQMGAGIAEVAAGKGIEVWLCDVTRERAVAAQSGVFTRLERLAQKGKIPAEAVALVRERLNAAELDDALAEADFVIEAASENPQLKAELFARADQRAPAEAVLATNTSSISITRLGAATRRPDRVAGMHFMNPVPRMKLVELVRGLATSSATLDCVKGLAERLEKTVISSLDSPGFLVNRMLIPFLNEACFALSE